MPTTRRLQPGAGGEGWGGTVGCGDAFLGAFVAATAGGKTPVDALVDAVACSAASACTAVTARFDPAAMAELRENVSLRAP